MCYLEILLLMISWGYLIVIVVVFTRSHIMISKINGPVPLTKDNYYSHSTDFNYLSFSVFRDFEGCEAATLAKLEDKYLPDITSKALLVGNYVHSYFEGSEQHEKFITENENNIITKSGNLRSEFKTAASMIDVLKNDQLFQNVYMPGEKEVIVTGKINDLWWKGKIDSLMLDKGYFCDLKTVNDFHRKYYDNGTWQNFVFNRNYQMQMAIYQELIKQTFGVDCKPYIFAVSKQNPPDKLALSFEKLSTVQSMKDSMNHIKATQQRYWNILMGEQIPRRCEQCEYCRQTKQLTGFMDVSEIEID